MYSVPNANTSRTTVTTYKYSSLKIIYLFSTLNYKNQNSLVYDSFKLSQSCFSFIMLSL